MIEISKYENYYDTVPSGIPTGRKCDVCNGYSELYLEVKNMIPVNNPVSGMVYMPTHSNCFCKSCLNNWIDML